MWCGVRDLPSKEHRRFTYRLSGASGEEQNILFSEVREKAGLLKSWSWNWGVQNHETSTFLLFKSQTKPRFSLTVPFMPFLNLVPLPLPCVSVLEIRSQVTTITTLNSWSSCLHRLSAEITGMLPQCLALALPTPPHFLLQTFPVPYGSHLMHPNVRWHARVLFYVIKSICLLCHEVANIYCLKVYFGEGCGDGSAGKNTSVQAFGPEFWFPALTQKAGLCEIHL